MILQSIPIISKYFRCRTSYRLLIMFCAVLFSGLARSQSYYNNRGDIVLKVSAAEAVINKSSCRLVRTAHNDRSKSWVVLKNADTKSDSLSSGAADATFNVRLPRAGIYYLRTYASPTSEKYSGAAYIQIQIDQQRKTRRIVFDAYNGPAQVAGKFEFNGEPQQIKLWLPAGIQLGYLEFKEFIEPAVPEVVKKYQPKIMPGAGHPRLWVNQGILPQIRARLTQGENKAAWEKVEEEARQPFVFKADPSKEIFYNEQLEKVAETKAFYYLMKSDQKVGREAVALMIGYLSVLEFGNVTSGDITREVGRAVYTAALVYDWCFDLLSPQDQDKLYMHMKRLAHEMAIGWPPFDESVINGHGNEAQVSRDLLAMSIAVYDQDPEPYRYTSYRMLEQLVPMRKFEYQSPRHNQGVDYGAYRFGWEMHGVWLLYRMSGMTSFDDNIKELPDYWLYMRLPDGYMLRDGDMFSVKNQGSKPLYWKQPQTMLLSYAYSNNALIKGEFERQGGLPDNPVLFLLLNDPALKADHDLSKLSQTKDFGPVLGSMIARTGWKNNNTSNDVIAEIKGGGYNFGNHQHADAGAIQLFYRGMQFGDLGLYLSYGSDYDLNFNKRSVAHSTMLVRDPSEQLLFRTKVRDGGSRFSQRFPLTPRETMTDPWYNYGSVVSTDFGPDILKPSFSYFKADLTAAFTSKIERFTREFCFFDLKRNDVPAVIIVSDDVRSTNLDFEKYFQVNALNAPDTLGSSIILHSTLGDLTGKTHINMLVPSTQERTTQVLSGKMANSTFEKTFDITSGKPEASGHRILISPKSKNKYDRFLTVFQTLADSTKPLDVKFSRSAERYELVFADRFVSLSSSADPVQSAFTIQIPQDTTYQVVLAGMKPGFWHVKAKDNSMSANFDVKLGKNTLYFTGKGTEYEITPARSAQTKEVMPPERP